jgi:hypothetical protein
MSLRVLEDTLEDPDDEELEQTPQYVVDRLGFDPKELRVGDA